MNSAFTNSFAKFGETHSTLIPSTAIFHALLLFTHTLHYYSSNLLRNRPFGAGRVLLGRRSRRI